MLEWRSRCSTGSMTGKSSLQLPVNRGVRRRRPPLDRSAPERTFEELFAQAGPDVSLQMTASTAAPVTGTNSATRSRVRNNRPSPTGSVVVTDQLPAQVTFVRAQQPVAYAADRKQSHRHIPRDPGGGSATITFVVSLNCDTANGAAIINDATAEDDA